MHESPCILLDLNVRIIYFIAVWDLELRSLSLGKITSAVCCTVFIELLLENDEIPNFFERKNICD